MGPCRAAAGESVAPSERIGGPLGTTGARGSAPCGRVLLQLPHGTGEPVVVAHHYGVHRRRPQAVPEGSDAHRGPEDSHLATSRHTPKAGHVPQELARIEIRSEPVDGGPVLP